MDNKYIVHRCYLIDKKTIASLQSSNLKRSEIFTLKKAMFLMKGNLLKLNAYFCKFIGDVKALTEVHFV